MIQFDVGGHGYKVSRSMIELYPESMLARLISDEWNATRRATTTTTKNSSSSSKKVVPSSSREKRIKLSDDTAPDNDNNKSTDAAADTAAVDDDDASTDDDQETKTIFIDRDGLRFRYVLDYLRDHEINLPMTESREAMHKELEYYGLCMATHSSDTTLDENGNATAAAAAVAAASTRPVIKLGTPVEAARVIAAMDSNIGEELDALDVEIESHKKIIQDYIHRKDAVKVARNVFQRSVLKYETAIEQGTEFTVEIVQKDEKDAAYKASKYVLEFLKEKLATYGLLLVKYNAPGLICWGTDETTNFTLKSSK